ncbi:Copine-5 [Bagarius yarrelli]|uniref:Copine-5 n=1 Tax=Bagarius yarrelli TaxID=175774 RepID=A0A556V3X1_BAGYA|nr:Copine-5 [Bagarius yarrelli]
MATCTPFRKPSEFNDFLGQMFGTLGEIVGSPASRLEKTLGGIPGKKCGTIILSAEELGNCRDSATMQFCANKLDKKDFFGKSDPFMVFFRSNEDGTFTICHKTEVVKNTLNPVWQSFNIPVRALCNGDYDRTQINFTVAIDFTASNGNPSQSTSLHYMNPYQMNAYAMALKAVGEIIQDYDSDKMFPALGFGAKLPPDGRVSHEFPLNGNIENPYCNGIEGILEAYHQSLKTVQLYGPTNFAPVVNHVARYAAAVQDGSQYFVLLIITDGVISDMAQTKEAIVNGAKLPMSIIIVGVGQAEFDAMVELDGDDIRISSRGKLAERDIVQYLPMAPSDFEQQTRDILCCFFDEPYLETDSPTDDFDPVKIATQLRQLGDHYDETVIKPLMHKVQHAASGQAGDVFTKSVDSLCNTWVAETPGIAPEKYLLKATMALSLYMKKNCLNLTTDIRSAIFNILNNRLRNWIMQQGGWVSLNQFLALTKVLIGQKLSLLVPFSALI